MKVSRVAAAAAGAVLASVLVGAPAHAENIGNERCTPGYWKNHTSNW
jgi:hypothetical protein